MKRKSTEQRFWEKVNFGFGEDACWIWMGAKLRDGYGQFRVNGKGVQTHRHSFKTHNGVLSDEEDVLHRCDNPSCIRPNHLFKGNDILNSLDRKSKDRQSKGEDHAHSKLTEQEVLEMRKIYSAEDTSMRKLGKKFGICYSEVNAIINRRTWKHI